LFLKQLHNTKTGGDNLKLVIRRCQII